MLRGLMKQARCFGQVPGWIGNLHEAQKADKGTSVNYDIKMYDEILYEPARYIFDEKVYEGLTLAAKAAFCGNDTDKEYVCIGEAFAFPDWGDNPVVNDPQHPAKLWWDPSVGTEKVMVQLGPHIPPALWIPIRPTHEAVKRLFSDFTTVDAIHLERYLTKFEETQQKYEEQTNTTLVESGGNFRASDHFRDGLRFGSVAELRKDYPLATTLYLGTVDHPSDIEKRILSDPPNTCLFSWPILSAKQDETDVPSYTAFRSVFSKSIVLFMTRMDLSPAFDCPEGLSVTSEAPVFAHIVYPEYPRMSGGKQLIKRFNANFGAEFPDDIPVDVAAALWRFNAVGKERLAAKLERMISTLPEKLGRTTDERKQINEIATTTAALAGVGDEGFVQRTATLRTRPEPQLRLAVAVGYNMLGLADEFASILAAETDPEVSSAMESHSTRSKGLTSSFTLSDHSLETASNVINPTFTAQSPEELDAQKE
eukprot:TRINITY_DN13711_c0_g1_i1.p1 TRINITY_DN13711_c0_g1~~TRINITY_DN13711_c0_g1_i1.p1  ORF type:complete len:481 (+),score=92.62 TRINITY_DN13711_c0_g1_i1:49-1491(+)